MIRLREQLEEFERYITEVILDREQGRTAEAWRLVLAGFSFLFTGVARARVWAYRKRLFRAKSIGTMVVSVGNLTVGGTGKTPVVELLATELAARGRRVAVLSRGYKSKQPPLLRRIRDTLKRRKKRRRPRVVSDGTALLLDSRMAGDEPYMLAKNLRGRAAVIVDRDRVKSGLYAITSLGSDTLVLDDGFQYLRLKNRISVVLVDSTSPFGNGHLLPRGVLREPIHAIRRADWIILTKCTAPHMDELVEKIRRHNRTASIIHSRHKMVHLRNIVDETEQELGFLKKRRIGALSAIARPESFENALKDLGAEIPVKTHFEDHHRYTERDLKAFIDRCVRRDLDAIVTTEKDAVKFPPLPDAPIPIFFLRMEIEILSGHEEFQRFLKIAGGDIPFGPVPRVY